MKNYYKRMGILVLSIIMAFTSIIISGIGTSDAASYIKLNAKASGQTSVSLRWTKLTKSQKKKIDGIAVFRNGSAINMLGKDSAGFSDTGLVAGTKYTYKIKTYKKTKSKQWYNRKTGKWQKKKPAKKDRGKSRKVTTYKYSNASSSVSVTTVSANNDNYTSGTDNSGTGGNGGSGGSGGSESPTDSGTLYEDTTTYFNFSGIQIHMGQQWTDTLKSHLANKSNGTKTYTRAGTKVTGWKEEKLCMFNTNTYNPFLCVYVVNGRISGWGDNASCLGVIKGQTVNRDDPSASFGANTGYGILKFYVGENRNVRVIEIIENGHGSMTNSQTERNIGFHYINAARVTYNKAILKRDKYLEGVDLETGQNLLFTGTIDDYYYELDEYDNIIWHSQTFENQRYGAQAWAETMSASGKASHSIRDMTAGPCYNVGDENILSKASQRETGIATLISNENVAGGSGGEMAIFSYSGSVLHCAAILTGAEYIGLGFCNGYHCERFGNHNK